MSGTCCDRGQLDAHERMLFQILRKRRHDIVMTEGDRRVHAQHAAWRHLRVAGFRFREVDQRDHFLAARQIAIPSIGQCDAARRAIQKTRAQVRLEFGDRARRLRGRNVHVLRGDGKACRLGYPDKDSHAAQEVHWPASFLSSRKYPMHDTSAQPADGFNRALQTSFQCSHLLQRL
jgi:hypothetical protein